MTALLIGIVSAILTIALIEWIDRRRSSQPYASSLVIAALIYVCFSAVEKNSRGLLIEFAGVVIFTMIALLGVKKSAWWLASGWTAHVGWDYLLHSTTATPFVPHWYPDACVGFDFLFAGYIAWRQINHSFKPHMVTT